MYLWAPSTFTPNFGPIGFQIWPCGLAGPYSLNVRCFIFKVNYAIIVFETLGLSQLWLTQTQRVKAQKTSLKSILIEISN
jgi:hypothetical protein